MGPLLHISLLCLALSPLAVSAALRLTEISPASSPEWFELKNTADTSLSLSGCALVDILDGDSIALPVVILGPGERIVITADSIALRQSCPFAGIAESPHWAILLNTGAALRLVSGAGILDSVTYPGGISAGSSFVQLALEVPGAPAGSWILCSESTPGLPDASLAWRAAPAPRLILPLRVFTPDGDGREDRFPIELEIPGAYEATVSLWGLDGTEIFSFGAVQQERIWWNGSNNTGRPAPRGPFVVVVRLTSGDTTSLLRGAGVLWRP